MAQSNYPLWIADQKYVRAYEYLGGYPDNKISVDYTNESFETRQSLILALRQKIYDFARMCKQPLSVEELGIDFVSYQKYIPDLIQATFLDLSLRTNPGYPFLKDIGELYLKSYSTRLRPQ